MIHLFITAQIISIGLASGDSGGQFSHWNRRFIRYWGRASTIKNGWIERPPWFPCYVSISLLSSKRGMERSLGQKFLTSHMFHWNKWHWYDPLFVNWPHEWNKSRVKNFLINDGIYSSFTTQDDHFRRSSPRNCRPDQNLTIKYVYELCVRDKITLVGNFGAGRTAAARVCTQIDLLFLSNWITISSENVCIRNCSLLLSCKKTTDW